MPLLFTTSRIILIHHFGFFFSKAAYLFPDSHGFLIFFGLNTLNFASLHKSEPSHALFLELS